jgi:hypothetical protein
MKVEEQTTHQTVILLRLRVSHQGGHSEPHLAKDLFQTLQHGWPWTCIISVGHVGPQYEGHNKHR